MSVFHITLTQKINFFASRVIYFILNDIHFASRGFSQKDFPLADNGPFLCVYMYLESHSLVIASGRGGGNSSGIKKEREHWKGNKSIILMYVRARAALKSAEHHRCCVVGDGRGEPTFFFVKVYTLCERGGVWTFFWREREKDCYGIFMVMKRYMACLARAWPTVYI